jgi:ABC-type nitrate/sulfonate/bicarbonate transport system ATPase subunit
MILKIAHSDVAEKNMEDAEKSYPEVLSGNHRVRAAAANQSQL